MRFRFKREILFFLFFTSCRPCSEPILKIPSTFLQQECVKTCMGDLPEANLANWWEQFDDSLLLSLIERGIKCNYDLQIARERICEARALFKKDFSTLLPQLDAFVLFNRNENSLTLSQPDSADGTFIDFYQTGFDSIWELDLFGKNLERARAAGYDVVATRAHVRDVHVCITSEIAATYFLIRTLQERIQITKRHIKAGEELLEIVEDRFKAGLSSQLDTALTKALLQERRAILPNLQSDFYKAIYALAVLVADLPQNIVDHFCQDAPLPCIEAKFPLGLPTELLCRRGDIREAEFEMRAAGARVTSARKEFFPTISLESLYSYATGFFTSWIKPTSQQWTITPYITLPLFHGGEILSHVQFETSLQKQSVLNYEKRVLKAVEEVESALVGYFQQGSRVHELREKVEAYREARDLSTILYKGGMIDFLYVIDTERDLFLSELIEAENKEIFMAQMVAVYKALGGGWECCD